MIQIVLQEVPYMLSVDGKSFEVHDPRALELQVLPKYFRHCRFQSLVRQLNFYAFKVSLSSCLESCFIMKLTLTYIFTFAQKVGKERSSWVYTHEFFRRDHSDLLVSLKRKTNGGTRDAVAQRARHRAEVTAKSKEKHQALQDKRRHIMSTFYTPFMYPMIDMSALQQPSSPRPSAVQPSLEQQISMANHQRMEMHKAFSKPLFLDNFFASCSRCVHHCGLSHNNETPPQGSPSCHDSMTNADSMRESVVHGMIMNKGKRSLSSTSTTGSDCGMSATSDNDQHFAYEAMCAAPGAILMPLSYHNLVQTIFDASLKEHRLSVRQLDELLVLLLQCRFKAEESASYEDFIAAFKSQIISHLQMNGAVAFELAMYMQALDFPIHNLPFFKAKITLLKSRNDREGLACQYSWQRSYEDCMSDAMLQSLGLVTAFSGNLTNSQLQGVIAHFIPYAINVLREMESDLLELNTKVGCLQDCGYGHFNLPGFTRQVQICLHELVTLLNAEQQCCVAM